MRQAACKWEPLSKVPHSARDRISDRVCAREACADYMDHQIMEVARNSTFITAPGPGTGDHDGHTISACPLEAGMYAVVSARLNFRGGAALLSVTDSHPARAASLDCSGS